MGLMLRSYQVYLWILKIKIWNKTEPIKIEAEESAFDEFRDDD